MNKLEAVAALPARVPLRDRIAAKLVLGQLAQWSSGALTVSLPDATVLERGDPTSVHRVRVTVRDWRFFWRALTAGDIGVGESYMAGEWECDDLVALCRLFVRDQSMLEYRSTWTLPARLRHALLRVVRAWEIHDDPDALRDPCANLGDRHGRRLRRC